ncbi:MAG: sigma-70 family RNA polymerase sigma factor [Nannocystaceae bacterium]|nr:sigma-70 family RNA polymerase sigma factor [Nannocystaceae bacterium]
MNRSSTEPGGPERAPRDNLVVLSALDGHGERGATDFHRAWRVLEQRNAALSEFVNLAFDHCHAMVYAIANRITGSRWEAEDVTQAVFEALLEQLPKIREHARVPGFLRTCAVRIALRQVKRSRWRRNRAELAFAFDPQQFIGDQPAMAAMVRQLLARLEPEERAALVLKCVELHSHEEVAELMGVSVATARRRLDSARRKLGAMVGETRVDEILGGAMAVAAGAEA